MKEQIGNWIAERATDYEANWDHHEIGRDSSIWSKQFDETWAICRFKGWGRQIKIYVAWRDNKQEDSDHPELDHNDLIQEILSHCNDDMWSDLDPVQWDITFGVDWHIGEDLEFLGLFEVWKGWNYATIQCTDDAS